MALATNYFVKLAKKKKGSNNFNKQKWTLAKVHEKIANCRKDFTHKISAISQWFPSSQMCNECGLLYSGK